MTGVAALNGKSVDRCDRCHGLFVSRDVLHLLERDWFLWPESETHNVDSGDPAVGERLDEIGKIDCPGCGAAMTPISVPDQPHIWLEQCPACEGVFFDAGELTDLRYHTMADWARDFLKGPREEADIKSRTQA